MNGPAAARDVGVRRLAELCARIDELGPPATGELVVRADSFTHGSEFVEGGRVCWAAARGLARRLTELLGERAALSGAEMEAFFKTCRAKGQPLGEHLVARGVLAPGDLREALAQHTAESLSWLCVSQPALSWSPRPGKGYSPRFTFTTTELLARVGAASHPAASSALAPVLRDVFEEEDWGAAYVRVPGAALPQAVAVWGAAPGAATSVVRLGRWATSALDLVAAFSAPDALVATRRGTAAGGRSLIAFRQGDGFVAGEADDFGPARILNRRASKRWRGGERGDV